MRIERRARWKAARLSALTVGAVLAAAACASPAFHGVEADPPTAVADVGLSNGTGPAFRLSDRKGMWVLLFFGYTNCPDVCPLTLSHIGTVLRDLGPTANRVAVVFVSVDPDRDTPDRLAQYAASFGPQVIGVTGERAEIDAAVEAFGARYELHTDEAATSAAGYSVSHSGDIFVIDPEQRLRLTIPFGVAPDAILSDLRRLIGPSG
ncbi:MAG: SCO family protein [Ardenticatenales bacterium]|nr:SCO family protein [Ardenticatenales bacterium]